MAALLDALSGFGGGALVGALVQRSRLCTFGALEDAWMGHDFRRLKIFGFALGIAILLTQGMIWGGWLDPDRTTYLPAQMPVVGLVAGGLLFGIGMALVGTCGFGSLVRLGTGDLRALVVIMVFGAVAYATLRGVLAGMRISLVEPLALAMPGPSRSDLPTQIDRLAGGDSRVWLAGLVSIALIALALVDKRLRRARRLFTAALVLGLVVALGWAATGVLHDPFDLKARPQSLTFVAPVARTLFGVLSSHDSWLDFDIMSVIGVACGAFAASLYAREFRWEAFDDHYEMRRHLIGAVCMGFGGVLAGGCTIGQGMSAGSLLALSMPLALVSMALGARLGIAIMLGEWRS